MRVWIKDNGCGSDILFFVEHSECTAPCLAYATFTGGPLDNACNYFIGIPSITVAADCCNVTPTHRTSWGDLKVLYR